MARQCKSPSPLWGGIKGGGREQGELRKTSVCRNEQFTPTGSRIANARVCQPPHKGEAVSGISGFSA